MLVQRDLIPTPITLSYHLHFVAAHEELAHGLTVRALLIFQEVIVDIHAEHLHCLAEVRIVAVRHHTLSSSSVPSL